MASVSRFLTYLFVSLCVSGAGVFIIIVRIVCRLILCIVWMFVVVLFVCWFISDDAWWSTEKIPGRVTQFMD